MGRRAKTGLDYFPKNVAFYDDFKIMELLDEYGPNGITIYDATLCVIYGNGYYIECPDMNQLAAKIIKCWQQVAKKKALCVTSDSICGGYRVIR